MAIDTARKRASAMGFGTHECFIIPNGSIDAFDRATIAGCYGGILAALPDIPGEWFKLTRPGDSWASATGLGNGWNTATAETDDWN